MNVGKKGITPVEMSIFKAANFCKEGHFTTLDLDIYSVFFYLDI